MKWTALAIGLFSLQLNVAGAQILPPMEGYAVDVTFSEKLERRMASINRLEQSYEEKFRESRHSRRSFPETGTQRYAGSETTGTEWGSERLIADPPGFTVENLVKSMVAYNINRAVPDFRGRIEIDIGTLKLSNPSIAFLDSFRSYVVGRVTVTDAEAGVLFNDKVTANLVIQPTVNRAYNGPELAFAETEPSKRVGPALANFIERALESVWPEHRDQIVGPVIVRVSGPHERVIFD